jgi:hypothetical protein
VVRSRCERSEPLAGIGILLLPSFDTPVTVNKQTNHHSSSLLIVNEETHNARQAKDLGWLHHQQRTCCCCFCLRSQAYLVCTSRALHKRADVPKHDGIVILSSSVSNRWLVGCGGGGGHRSAVIGFSFRLWNCDSFCDNHNSGEETTIRVLGACHAFLDLYSRICAVWGVFGNAFLDPLSLNDLCT